MSLAAAAAAEARSWEAVLRRTGHNPVTELLRGVSPFYHWQHYPAGDVQDGASGSQYYYHAHTEPRWPEEHGHFHLFVRPAQLGLTLEPVPGQTLPDDPEEATVHLAALSMTGDGRLTRLFTTNRWVTDEYWQPAPAVIPLLEHFHVDHAQPSWPLNRWLACVVTAFRAEIIALLEQRDAKLEAWRRQHGDDVFEDRNLEVTSDCAVDLAARAGE